MSVCPGCGTLFSCGMVDGVATDPCWCMALPALPAAVLASAESGLEGRSCFCPLCLRAKTDVLATDLSRGPR
jgi:hypothetical protein